MLEIKMRPLFRKFLLARGFKIIQEEPSLSPDFIVEKDGRKIGIELKGTRPGTDLATGLGQLLLAKFKEKVDEMWLIIPVLPLESSRDWIELLFHHQVKLLLFKDDSLCTVDIGQQLRRRSTKEFGEIEARILTLLDKHPEGLTRASIARSIDVDAGTVRSHVDRALKGIGSPSFESRLKGKIISDGKKIILRNV